MTMNKKSIDNQKAIGMQVKSNPVAQSGSCPNHENREVLIGPCGKKSARLQPCIVNQPKNKQKLVNRRLFESTIHFCRFVSCALLFVSNAIVISRRISMVSSSQSSPYALTLLPSRNQGCVSFQIQHRYQGHVCFLASFEDQRLVRLLF